MTSVRPPGATALLLVLASGCKGCDADEPLPTLLESEDATPVGVWVSEALGTSPVTVPLYAVNALGAPVSAGDLALVSDATVPASATPGADGWAEAELTGDPGSYGVQASVSGVSGEGAAWVADGTPGRIDARAVALPGAPSLLARAGDGIAAAVGSEVWWTGLDGRQPARVLALPDDVVAISAVELDGDGVTDLVVTSASRLVALRGRDGGGLTWGGGWSAAGERTVVAASVADFDGDNFSDLAVVLDDGGVGVLSILGGDGAWGFSQIDVLEPGYAVWGLSIDDLDDNGVGEVTFLTDAGLLRRYTKVDGSWAQTLAGTQYELELAFGGRLLPSADLSGDGVPDLVAYGPATDGTSRAWIVTAGADEPSRYAIVDADDAYPWVGFATGDLTGDGAADFVYTAPGKLARGFWTENDDGGTYMVQSWTDVPATGAVAIADVDADGIADVIVGEDAGLRVFPGARSEDDPGTTTDEASPWKVATPQVDLFGLDLTLPPVVADVTGDAVVDVVGVAPATDVGVALKGVLGVAATDTTVETLRSGGSVTVSGSGAALDLAVCGSRAFVLYEEADDEGALGTWLARANLGAGMGPALAGAAIAVTGETLACGDFASGEVAVTDASGAVTYVDAAGTATLGESIGAVGDLAAVDGDGDGVDELVACAEAGCSVAAADLDGDGVVELVVQDSAGIVVTIGGVAETVDAPGAVTVADADGDGLADLVVGDDGAARVYRALAGGISPAVVSWTWRPVSDAVFYGDLDGDGLPDAFLVGEDRHPDTTDGDDWAGTLVYAHATAE